MLSITHIYVKYRENIKSFLPIDMPLDDLLALIRNGEHISFAASVYDDIQKRNEGLDVMTILQERCTPQTATWQQLIDQISDEWIEGYKHFTLGFHPGTDVPHRTESVFYPFGGKGLIPHYCNLRTPLLKDIFQFRWNMPDLSVEKDTTVAINFDNCFAIVNGIATYCHVFEDQLYIHNGAKLLWCTDEEYRPEMILIDTSPLGELEMYHMSQCDCHFRNRVNQPWLNSEWEIVLPGNITFHTHTILPVIGGVLYLPGEYRISSSKSFIVHPQELMLDKQLLHQYRASARLEDTIYQTEESIATYLKETMWSKTHHDAFLIAIKNPQIYVHKTMITPYALHRLGIVNGIHGLLRYRSSKLIGTYMESNYNTMQLLYTDNTRNAFFFDTPYEGITPGVDAIRLKKHPFDNLRETVSDLIHLCTY